MNTMNFVEFTGEENEREFLKKCLEQWELTNNVGSEMQKLMLVGTVFNEIRHRLRELED